MFWKCEYKTLCELRIQWPEKAIETENCGHVLANKSPLKCPAQPTGPNSVKNCKEQPNLCLGNLTGTVPAPLLDFIDREAFC